MVTITKERPETRERVTRQPQAPEVRQAEEPEPRVPREAVARPTARQDKQLGFVDRVVRSLGALFAGLGSIGQATYSLQGSRLISPGEKTLINAETIAYKQILPFTMPGTSALRRGSRNFLDG